MVHTLNIKVWDSGMKTQRSRALPNNYKNAIMDQLAINSHTKGENVINFHSNGLKDKYLIFGCYNNITKKT